MRNKTVIIALVVIAILLTVNGCSSKETTEGEKYIKVEMTDEEKSILCESFVDEDRIKEGKLNRPQKIALDELRACVELIKNKYPNLKYEIQRYTPATKLTTQGILDLSVDGDDINTYEVFVIYDENNKINLTETVYGFVKRSEYDKYISDVLEKNNISAKSYTDFVTPVGDEIEIETSVKDIISLGSNNVRYTDLFIEDTPDKGAVVKQIESVLTKEKINAVYEVSFVTGSIEKPVSELERNRSNFECQTIEITAN